jgi:MFS family permease
MPRLLNDSDGWVRQLPVDIKHNLRWFFMDGVFASAQDGIVVTYLTLFILALGASSAQIGLLAAASSILATIMLLPGAILAERSGKRKAIILFSGGGISRVAILLLALLPFVVKGSAVVWVAIGIKVVSDGFANLSLPAWTSLTADIVPLQYRGRYFSTRTLVMSIAAMTTTFIVGQLITHVKDPGGYQIALGLAFILGIVSSISYSRLREPVIQVPDTPHQSYSPRTILATIRSNPGFMAFCMHAIVWNFSLNIAGPFFNVYLVRDLNATAALVGTISIISSISSMPAMGYLGHLSDRWGARKLMLVMGFIIPIMPVFWFLINAAWMAIPFNIIAGVLWAGFGLANFNLLLEISPAEQRVRYSAIYQILVLVSSAVGASLGGAVVAQWGIRPVFLISAVGRAIAMLVFFFMLRKLANPLSLRKEGVPDNHE